MHLLTLLTVCTVVHILSQPNIICVRLLYESKIKFHSIPGDLWDLQLIEHPTVCTSMYKYTCTFTHIHYNYATNEVCSKWFILRRQSKIIQKSSCSTLKTSLGWRSYGVFRLRLPAALPKAKYIISHHCLLRETTEHDDDMASPDPQTHIHNI